MVVSLILFSVILATSTNAPNPLQAISSLHARPPNLPPWVDPTALRYTLIVHTNDTNLNDEECSFCICLQPDTNKLFIRANALFNAVKKQYGFNSYLLSLTMPTPAPQPVPVPALMPKLPPLPNGDSPHRPAQSRNPSFLEATSPAITPGDSPPLANTFNSLRMVETDIQETAKFAREFTVMSLVPWMEKCVAEWNENVGTCRLGDLYLPEV